MAILSELVKWREENFRFLPIKYEVVPDTIAGFADTSPTGFYRVIANVDGDPDNQVIIAVITGLTDVSKIPQGPGLLEILDCIHAKGEAGNNDRSYLVYPFRGVFL